MSAAVTRCATPGASAPAAWFPCATANAAPNPTAAASNAAGRKRRSIVMARPDSNLERFQGFGREQLLGLEAAFRQPLLVVIAQKSVERVAVGLEAVGPPFLAHQPLGFFQMRALPGQHGLLRGDQVEIGIGLLLRREEGLGQRQCDPAVGLVEFAPQHHCMHNREDLGLAVIGLFDLDEIREQPLHLVGLGIKGRGQARRIDCIQFAGRSIFCFSTRPGSSSPPVRYCAADMSMPYSSWRMPFIQTMAVSCHSGLPMRLPTRSFGSLMPLLAEIMKQEWRNMREGKTGMAMKSGCSFSSEAA